MESMDVKNMHDEEVLTLSIKNPDAFGVIVDRYEQSFLRKAEKILRNRQDAEDAVQESFIKIYTAAKRFVKVEGAKFSSWAYRILINHCCTIYKKKKKVALRMVDLDLEIQELIPDQIGAEFEEKRRFTEDLLMAVSKLPDQVKSIATAMLRGDSDEQIAVKEGISESTVRSRLHRAKKDIEKNGTFLSLL